MAALLHAVKVGGQSAVGGLTWRDTPGDDPAAVREQVRAAASGARSKFGVRMESGSGAQVGMLPENAPSNARNKYSAAAWLASVSMEPVLYIEQLPDARYWIVRTDAGYVDPRTDVLLEEGDASRFLDDLLEQIVASGDNAPNVFMVGSPPPSHMLSRQLAEVTQRSFADLVQGMSAPKATQLKQLIGVTPATYLGVVGVVVVLATLYGGYLAFEHFQQQREFEARRAELAQRDADAARIKNETELRMRIAVEQAAKEDTATLSPSELTAACVGALDRFGSRIAGWRVATVECDGAGTGITFGLESPRRTGELISTASILMQLTDEQKLALTINPSNGMATVTQPQQALEVREGIRRESMPRYTSVLRGLLSRLQMGKAAIPALSYQMEPPTVRAVTYIDPALEGNNDASKFKQVPPDQTYRKGTVNLRGIGRWALEEVSLEYPFLTITKLELRPSIGAADLTWVLEAFYVTNS